MASFFGLNIFWVLMYESLCESRLSWTAIPILTWRLWQVCLDCRRQFGNQLVYNFGGRGGAVVSLSTWCNVPKVFPTFWEYLCHWTATKGIPLTVGVLLLVPAMCLRNRNENECMYGLLSVRVRDITVIDRQKGPQVHVWMVCGLGLRPTWMFISLRNVLYVSAII
jgi:hypothetical protein